MSYLINNALTIHFFQNILLDTEIIAQSMKRRCQISLVVEKELISMFYKLVVFTKNNDFDMYDFQFDDNSWFLTTFVFWET